MVSEHSTTTKEENIADNGSKIKCKEEEFSTIPMEN